MTQPTKAPSALQTVASIKAGKEGGRAPPSASRPVGPIAIEGEGWFVYLHKMMALGGPAGPGEGELQVSAKCLFIPIPSTALPLATDTHPQPALPKPHIPLNQFPICPSLASENHHPVSILFAMKVVEHYSGYQGQFPAAANTSATEVVVPEGITQNS